MYKPTILSQPQKNNSWTGTPVLTGKRNILSSPFLRLYSLSRRLHPNSRALKKKKNLCPTSSKFLFSHFGSSCDLTSTYLTISVRTSNSYHKLNISKQSYWFHITSKVVFSILSILIDGTTICLSPNLDLICDDFHPILNWTVMILLIIHPEYIPNGGTYYFSPSLLLPVGVSYSYLT